MLMYVYIYEYAYILCRPRWRTSARKTSRNTTPSGKFYRPKLTYIYICIYKHLNTCLHVHTYIHIYICTYMMQTTLACISKANISK